MFLRPPVQPKPASPPLKLFSPARGGLLQRKCACGGSPGPSGECEECRKKRPQRKSNNAGFDRQSDSAIPPIVHEVLRSPGEPLDQKTRAFMEPRFGHDFSKVRVHTDAKAGESARAVDALAYTVGGDVVFGARQYPVETSIGKQLVAHELAHVVQQKNVLSSAGQTQLRIAPVEDNLERDAARLAREIVNVSNPRAPVSTHEFLPRGSTGRLQRAVASDVVDRTTIDEGPKQEPEIACSAATIGKYAASCMAKANEQPRTRCLGLDQDLGIHYANGYRNDCENAIPPHPERWKDDYYKGYADPSYFDRESHMRWRVRPGVSASVAIKKWLKGLTIAECTSTAVACEYDSLRATVGDTKFDEAFGSAEKQIPERQRMLVSQGISGTPLEKFIVPTGARVMDEEGTFGNRPAAIGEWYYFYNHPKYLLKHPGSAWQGENAFYGGRNAAGEQIWTGLGANKRTEQQLLSAMVIAYNFDPSPHDEEIRERIRLRKGGSLPDIYRSESEAPGGYPDKIDMFDIIADPPYTIVDPFSNEATTRKGGFDLGAAKKLSVERAQELRDK